ncbi:MAG: M28 family metallopeptidase [Promethearchaeota archaeon]
MNVKKDFAYRVADKLAFPRLVGSPREGEAIDIVSNEFKKIGYEEVNRESFQTSFYNWIISQYIFLPLGIFLIAMALTYYIFPLISLIFIGLMVYGLLKGLSLINSDEIKLLKDEEKNYETENVFVKLNSNKGKKKIIFMAHWDSKSQTFSSATRIAILMIAVFGYLILNIAYSVLIILTTIFSLDLTLLANVLSIACIIIAVDGFLNFFNKTGNESPGAIDNAGAVGVVMELARYFKENPIENIEFTFLIPSSEELNLGGAKYFLFNHEDEYPKEETYVINLDVIGGDKNLRLFSSYGIPKKNSSIELNNLILESGEELATDIKEVYLATGAWSDYMPFIKRGYKASWLGSTPGFKKVHTPEDNMTLVTKKGLKSTLKVCIRTAEKIANFSG